jgi:hypothetical protein
VTRSGAVEKWGECFERGDCRVRDLYSRDPMVGWWRLLEGWGGPLVLAGRPAIALCFKPSCHQATHYRVVPRADTMGRDGGPSTKRLLGRADTKHY